MSKQHPRPSRTVTAIALLAMGAALSTMAASCASEVTPTGDGDGNANAGGTGGGVVGGSGGGEMGGTGGEPPTSLCADDCSAIEPPDCYVAVCNEGQYPGQIGACTVVAAETGTDCDDGLFCTVNDFCEEGVCMGGGQNNCGVNPPACNDVICNESSQSCSTTPAMDGNPCVPADMCQVNGQCNAGQCEGNPKDCTFSPLAECNTVACNPGTGACEASAPANDGASCSLTGDLCMSGKTCNGGNCIGGSPKDCSALTSGCNNGLCDAQTGNCYADPVAPGGMCFDGVGQCEVGTCDANGMCQTTPGTIGMMCNDGNACTTNDLCDAAGMCMGTPDPGYTVYFQEDFANNSAGWTLGTDWEIGSAMASTGSFNNDDPAMDHTPTADNGVAGVVIGGLAPDVVHGYYWLESPIIDTSIAPGTVWLEFYRWLNSDYTPFMQNAVQVYNGSTWITLWESGPSPGIDDSSWTKVQHDLTAYKNANMRVRMGFQILSTAAFNCSSWNVDDVTIATQPCN